MPMYAIAAIPLIKKLQCAVDDVNQVWYADDASVAGKISRLRQWWNLLPHKALNLAILLMPPNLTSHKRKVLHSC